MKETGILMTPENGEKCFLATKLQTRRIIDPQPAQDAEWFGYLAAKPDDSGWYPMKGDARDSECWEQATGERLVCPYGVEGDRLWIREACWIYGRWKPNGRRGKRQRWAFEPASRGRQCTFITPLALEIRRKGELGWGWVRRPGIFMPRWACRTLVEITEVRVQRLQDISQADAIAEGGPPSHQSIDSLSRKFGYIDFSRSWYAQLWESINGAGSWESNPWVWAISFKKVTL